MTTQPLQGQYRGIRDEQTRGTLKNIKKTGSPGKTRTCDIWINSPPFQPQ